MSNNYEDSQFGNSLNTSNSENSFVRNTPNVNVNPNSSAILNNVFSNKNDENVFVNNHTNERTRVTSNISSSIYNNNTNTSANNLTNYQGDRLEKLEKTNSKSNINKKIVDKKNIGSEFNTQTKLNQNNIKLNKHDSSTIEAPKKNQVRKSMNK